ncbi:hypothetical protein DdX_06441 [Ditylenchus destructor]|uniref:Uncharacterized protein n=1 Tax=Ditylenchus destructor TaxID=166010 RepID=A0AAD4NAA1_9BILA|nr:hypothetical protein DdX_06441 [Ditylenchus destructor]
MIELEDIEVGQIVTGYCQPDLFFENVPLEGTEGACTANHQIAKDSNEDIQMESISLGTTIQSLSLADTGSSPLARRRQAVARRRGTDSEGVFRVESPLGILDDSKFEDEEISHDNVNNVSAPLLHDIIDKNKQQDKSTLSLQNSAPPPRLQPPPPGIPSNSMSNIADVENKEITTSELLSMDVSQNLPVEKGNSAGFWNPFTGNTASKATNSTSDWPAGCSAMTSESANMDWASLFLKEMDQTKMDDSAANNSLLM